MQELSPDTVLKVRPDVRFRRVLDEAVVVRQAAAEALVLNEVAAAVLEKCDGSASLAGIIEALEGEYEVDSATLRSDVLRFASELVESKVLEAETRP